jgi:hypothetical protein
MESRITPADKSTDWADDVQNEEKSEQLDGAAPQQGGNGEMIEPEYDVEVKLIDQSSPLYSVKSFQELGL